MNTKISKAKLAKILKDHAAWLAGSSKGARADLTSANLYGADLTSANLGHRSIVPECGAFIGWKRVCGAVLKLEILADAGRTSSYVGRKCRASAVKVLEAFPDAGQAPLERWHSKHDASFTYAVGDVATAPLDADPRVECTTGIHFFLTRKEAEEYR